MPELSLRAQVETLLQLALGACAGRTARLVWTGNATRGAITAAVAPGGEALVEAAHAALARHPTYPPRGAGRVVRLPASTLSARLLRNGHAEVRVTALALADDGAAVDVVMVAAAAGIGQLEAAAESAARGVLALLTARDALMSREFWRERATVAAEHLAGARLELAASQAAERRLASGVAAAQRTRPRNRLRGLGPLFGRLGPFQEWIVALAEAGVLRVAATSAMPAAVAVFDQASALVACWREQATILRTPESGQAGHYHEDHLFAHLPAYICVPLADGAIALGAREPLDIATIAAVEAFAARINPLVRGWLAELESERLRGLVRDLGLRLFAAGDRERARIARDLHDHQAQLLAAARIALEAAPDEARGIFKQLEDALRLRVRELRPTTLGRTTTLAEALRYELRRLVDAGIKGRLMRAAELEGLSRPVQHLCYQVAREAFANVLRHAGATRVEITVEKRRGHARLSILDNGRGIAPAKNRSGVGLEGLRERLELMGGKLRFESRPGATRLIAEVPELS